MSISIKLRSDFQLGTRIELCSASRFLTEREKLRHLSDIEPTVDEPLPPVYVQIHSDGFPGRVSVKITEDVEVKKIIEFMKIGQEKEYLRIFNETEYNKLLKYREHLETRGAFDHQVYQGVIWRINDFDSWFFF